MNLLDALCGPSGVVSPFTPLAVPRTYKDGCYGPWEIKTVQLPPFLRGYFLGLVFPGTPRSPTLIRNGKVWMSVTPMETESQALMLGVAQGHVVVMGLGMGVLLYNLMQKETVKRITVVEKCEELLEHFPRFSGYTRWPCHDMKIEFICADALRWKGKADVCLVDIWPSMGSTRFERDMRVIRSHVEAPRLMAWTQELAYISWCQNNGVPPGLANQDKYVRKWCAETGLYAPDDWGGLALAAAQNVVLY